MHILFAGGGTAGHINPALAVAGYIKEHNDDVKISYIGTKSGLESRLVPKEGYDFYTIDVAGFQRKITLKNVKRNISAACKAVTSSIAAKKLLEELKPDVVVGTGGYVSGPVLREATKLRIKTAIHEQNAFPGVTTKMLAPKVDRVMLAIPAAKKYLKLHKEPIITGNPIRQMLIKANRDIARKQLGLDNRPMILSFGGSLGARAINEAVVGLIEWHQNSGSYYHFHGTGKSGVEKMNQMLKEIDFNFDNNIIHVTEYIDNMDVLLAAADLVICRAGAITLGELQVCGKASILIPSPYVAENHQYYNAMSLVECGAAEIIEEKDLTSEALISKVKQLLNDLPRLNQMSQNAKKTAIVDSNKRIYDVIMDLLKNR